MIEDAINKPGVVVDRWVLRLGKNSDEAGKFSPWYLPPSTFEQDFAGFLACLNLLKLHEAVKERMSLQKKQMHEAKKLQRAAQKALDKEAVKAKRAAEKAQLKIDRAAEKERIKRDAKAAREAAKNVSVLAGKIEDTVPPMPPLPVCENVRDAAPGCPKDTGSEVVASAGGLAEESLVERRPFVIPEDV